MKKLLLLIAGVLVSSILVLTMFAGVFSIRAEASDYTRYIIDMSEFSSKDVIDCGQFSFYYSAQTDITKAVETAEKLTHKKYFIGWPSGRRYLTEAEAQMSASDLNADHASHLHTSDINGQITVNGTPNGFNIIVFTAPYTGDYQYTGKAHGWWTDHTTIKVLHKNTWYTPIPTVVGGSDNIKTTDTVSMQAGEKLYFIFDYNDTEGYDPVTLDVFNVEFLGPCGPIYTLNPVDVGNADDNFTFFVSQLPDMTDIAELTEVVPAGTAEAPGGWAGRGTGVVLPGETNHKYFVHRDADTENAVTVRFEGGYNKMLAFKAPTAGTYTISFNSVAWGNGADVTLMIFTMDTLYDPAFVSSITETRTQYTATVDLKAGEHLYVSYTTRASILNYAQISEIRVQHLATHTHTYDGGKVTMQPTCKDNGVKTYTCIDCGATKNEKLAKLTTHTYDNGKVTTQPTCKADGVKTYTCTICNGTKTEKVAKLTTHTYDSGKITTQPTCKSTGVKTYTCTVCKATKTEKVAKLTTHTYDSGNVTTQPTCKDEGVKIFTCTVCGITKEETIVKLETHSYEDEWTTNSGKHWHSCQVCGDRKDEGQHNFDNACDTSCNTCGFVRVTTHNYETSWEKNDSQHWHLCSVCGVEDSKELHVYDNTCDTTCNDCEYTRVTTHTYDTGKVTKEPTTSEEGENTFTCTVCGETKTESIPKIDPPASKKINYTLIILIASSVIIAAGIGIIITVSIKKK